MRRKRDRAGCCAMSALVLLMVKVIQHAASGCFHVTGMHLLVIGYTLIVIFSLSCHFCYRVVLSEMIQGDIKVLYLNEIVLNDDIG